MPKFGAQIDTQRIPIKGLIPEQGTVFPGSPAEGMLFHRTDLKETHQYLNSSWQKIAPAGAPLTHTHSWEDIEYTPTTFPPSAHDHFATQVNYGGGSSANLPASTVEAALDTVAFGIDNVATGLSDHIAAGGSAKHAAADISYAGSTNLSATTVEGALDELDSEKLGSTAQSTLNMNQQNITNLAYPLNDQDAASKTYVDNVVNARSPKESVRVATTANITLSGTQTIDGVSVGLGERVLVKNQTTASQNGIYYAIAGAWVRTEDADGPEDIRSAYVWVEEGTVNQDTGWLMTTDNVTLDTTPLVWTQTSGAGAINAGAGMTKTGNTLDVVGTSNRITVTADAVDIASTYVGQTSITTVGTIATGTWAATDVGVLHGGTGASDAGTARTNLGIASDAVAGTASMRTLGTGATQAAAGNHTHTKANITDFAHTHLIADLPTDATVPAALGTAAAGTSASVARRDHVHPMPTAANVGAAPTVHGHVLTDANITGTLAVAKGGTGATDAATARTNLGVLANQANATPSLRSIGTGVGEVAAGVDAVRGYSGLSPALTAGAWSASIAHGRNTDYVDVTCHEVTTGEEIILDWKRVDANNVQIRADLGIAANALRVLVTVK